MVKITKSLCMVLATVVLLISFSIPFMLFPSKSYADSVPYVIGDTGPAGGKVFYDKGDDIGGWRYLEAAPSDHSSPAAWSNITNAFAGTSLEIGKGQSNTTAIVNQQLCTSGAAKICNDLILNGYDDWFLPSDKELNLMYVNRNLAGLVGFESVSYWSSSEDYINFPIAADHALVRDMGTGGSGTLSKVSGSAKVRAIRAFSVPSGAAPPKPLTPQEQVMLNLSICQQADLYGKTNTGFVKTLYDNILGRVPDDEGLNNWETALSNKMTPKDVVYYFVFSEELKPKIALMGPEEFVTFLYKNVFNREPDSDGYNNWVSLMKNGMSKEDVLLLFLNCDEFKNICIMFGLTQ
jgi:hypothetical protein